MIGAVLRGWLAGLVCTLLLGLTAAWASGSAATPTAPTASRPVPGLQEGVLRSGRPFVLVVSDGRDRRLQRSEAYGDWQAYLQSFVERRRGDLTVHHASPEQAQRLLAKWPPDLRNATLFAHPNGTGLLHRGLVLEPEVYTIGKTFAEEGVSSGRAADHGLESFNWK